MTSRPYRWSMLAYPPAYRDAHGDELVDTALELNGGVWSARQALSFLRSGVWLTLRTPRRLWFVAVLVPIAYGALQLVNVGGGEFTGPTVWIAKVATIGSLLTTLRLLSERVNERPGRWKTVAATWAVVGVVMVLAAARFAQSIAEATQSAAYFRLWPGDDATLARLNSNGFDSSAFGANWTPFSIAVRELVAIIVIAAVAGVALRAASRLGAGGFLLVPPVLMVPLWVYVAATPWAFHADYDFFVGDALLGSVFGELLFLPLDFDPIAGAALGVASITMASLLAAWGGPVPAQASRRQTRVERFA